MFLHFFLVYSAKLLPITFKVLRTRTTQRWGMWLIFDNGAENCCYGLDHCHIFFKHSYDFLLFLICSFAYSALRLFGASLIRSKFRQTSFIRLKIAYSASKIAYSAKKQALNKLSSPKKMSLNRPWSIRRLRLFGKKIAYSANMQNPPMKKSGFASLIRRQTSAMLNKPSSVQCAE